jgi:hypothetical protein
MDDLTAELIPFHALNEFMRPDFRLHVVRTALAAQAGLPDNQRATLERLTKKLVTVQGFRNSAKAPARVRAVPTAEAFENSPDLVGAILAAWAEANSELRDQVFFMLHERGWHLLPLEAHRERLPGFFILWPESEDFQTLYKDYMERNPESKASDDDVSLMVVWVGMRLPYQMVAEPVEEVTRLSKREQESSTEAEMPIPDEPAAGTEDHPEN